jgi:MoaA/NifB/PqqE/SkfB family radical SAM enzyme
MHSVNLRKILTPEGLFVYDRGSGLCIFVPEAKSTRWLVPIYVQLQLTTACNRQCWWCYVEKNSMSWDLVEAKKLLKFLDNWGVFGVALGGGEPFVYTHLAELVKYAWLETGLDVSLTTNGTASTQQVRDIEGYVSEVRVSVRTLDEIENVEKFIGRKFEMGVNLLVHKRNIGEVEEIVEKCLGLGVKDFLISSFRATGAARKFHELELDDFSQVEMIVKRFWNRATFKLDCMLAEKTDLPKFPFKTPERGRIIAITPDKKVKPSSLTDESYSFENPEEIPEIYRKSIVG